jgi:uncharacterized protein with PIN domain
MINFICDDMLAKLARWLRILGFDTAFELNIPDQDLIDRSLRERRALLTQDKHLLMSYCLPSVCLLPQMPYIDQLKFVISRYDLYRTEFKLFSRCLICNNSLFSINKENIAPKIPFKVFDQCRDFYYCSNCDKIYWNGTHHKNICDTLKKAGILKKTEL